jgi:hypothetical protein
MLDALRASYPALNHMLGREAFDEFGLDYLFLHPSRSYTLLGLARGFPDHLAATRPDDGDAWSELVVDIARLERTFAEVYEGEGTEGEQPLAMGDLPLEPGSRWRATTVLPAPCLRLARYSHDIGAYVLAVRRGEQPSQPRRRESFLALSRRDYVVTFTALDAPQHRALTQLVHGAPLGPAADAAGIDAATAWQLLRLWARSGFFSTVTNPAARDR